MTKKIFIALLALTLPFSFAACNKEDETSTNSIEGTATVISATGEDVFPDSSVTESSTSSEDSSTVFGDVYEGEGYSISIPSGFTFYDEVDGTATFTTEAGSILSIIKEENTEGVLTTTQGQLEEDYAAVYGDIALVEYQDIVIDDKSNIYLMFTMEAEGKTVSVFTSIFFTEEYIYTITIEAFDEDYNELYADMIATFGIE